MMEDEQHPRFYVQGETVRGEARMYWVVDRYAAHLTSTVSARTRDKRQADRWCAQLAQANSHTAGQPIGGE